MEPKDKKDYEVGFLVAEEGKAGKVTELVKSAGGEILLQGPLNRLRLAYKIEKLEEAFFGFLQFSLEPGAAKKLEQALTLDADILRFLILTPPPLKEKQKPRSEFAPRPAQKPHASRPAESTSLSNEALEKKIEEILQ